jgi:hypothetical protein
VPIGLADFDAPIAFQLSLIPASEPGGGREVSD